MKFVKYLMISIILFQWGCKKSISIERHDLLPIIKSDFSFNQLSDSLIQSQGGEIHIIFDQNLVGVSDVVEIPPFDFEEFFAVPFQITPSAGNVFFSQDEKFNLSPPNGAMLSYAIINSGSLEMELSNPLTEDIFVTFSILGLEKSGVVFEKKERVSAGNASNFSYDISGYDLFMKDADGIYNSLVLRSSFQLDPDGQAVQIKPSDLLKIKGTIVGLNPYYIKGYFGNQLISLREAVALDFLKNVKSGYINFANVQLALELSNYAGIDLQFLMNEMAAKKSSNQPINLSHQIIGSVQNINRAVLSSGQLFPYTQTINVDESNSNITSLFGVLPDSIVYDIGIEVNPFGNISSENDFIYPWNPFSANLNMDIPLNLAVSDVVLTDTINWEKAPINILEGCLKLHASNKYPFDVKIQLFGLDENNQKILSISSDKEILAGEIDNNGRVLTEKDSEIVFDLPEEEMRKLSDVSAFYVEVKFNSMPSSTLVKVFDDYHLSFQLVGDLNYEVNVK